MHGIYFTMDEQRFEAVANAVAQIRHATDDLGRQQAQVATQQFALNSDWPEGLSHQDWLNVAPVAEIASWVAEGVRDWTDADFEDRH